MPKNASNRLLISCLDWGLGHTSRCVPIINYLRSLGHSVTFAGNDWQRQYIEKTFPGMDTIHLEGYNVHYGPLGKGLVFSVLWQVPGILRTIQKEHEWLNKLLQTQHFDGIISDNRYGLHHGSVPSVIITHQLEVQTGFGQIANTLFRKLHYNLLNRFSECWVPDVAGSPSLSGKLGHPPVLPRNPYYIGPLSQLVKDNESLKQDKALLILLSGVEPHRGILSKLLWEQMKGYKGKVIFVEGSSNSPMQTDIPSHIEHYQQLTKTNLSRLVNSADIVISRSGYSTIMDLIALNKKAILIPTPGQTEQEYLGKYLHQQGVFFCASQKGFELEKALREADNFPFHLMRVPRAFDEHEAVIDRWLQTMLPGENKATPFVKEWLV